MTVRGHPDTEAVSLWMSDLLSAGQTNASLESMAEPVDVVEADLPVAALDALFRSDPDLACVAVRPPAAVGAPAGSPRRAALTAAVPARTGGPGAGEVREPTPPARWGLLTRGRFQQLMTGPLGYGRLLLARKSAQEVADWSPLVVDAGTDVADVARLLVEDDVRDVAGAGTGPGAGSRGSTRSGAASPPAAARLGEPGGAAVSDLLVVQTGRELRRVPVTAVFRALSAQLAAQALTDPLTRLANRDHFLQFLHRCCRRPDPGERLAVVYIDLDGFKAFNDSYGHGVGDRVLQVVADRLRGCCRPQDLPARLGGDEFAIVVRLPADVPGEQAARSLGQRVLACLGGTITVGHLVLPGRASVGVAVADDSERTPHHGVGAGPAEAGAGERGSAVDAEVFARADVLLREADLAMYQAKAAGGHRVQVVTGVDHQAESGSPLIDRRELHRAVAAGEFVLHFQPIVEAGTGQLASVEALVRWQHPTRGLLGPGAFLDAVADAGFAAELDEHVLTTALDQLRAWTDRLGRQAPPFVNVNLSVQGLQTAGLAESVLAAVRRAGVAADRLRLEVPEAATVQHLRAAAQELTRLRAAGVRLTLDDLGAGASTLHHLTDLALDGMKIDRRFVASMLEDQRDAAVVRMLLELGLSTGLAVTAEGIETDEQLHLVREMARGRAVYVQGFLLGRPVPPRGLVLPWPQGVHARHAVSPRRLAEQSSEQV